MSQRQLLILIGLWVIIFLFLGFPSTGDKLIAVATGFLILIIAIGMKSRKREHTASEMPYAERKAEPAPGITNTNPPLGQ